MSQIRSLALRHSRGSKSARLDVLMPRLGLDWLMGIPEGKGSTGQVPEDQLRYGLYYGLTIAVTFILLLSAYVLCLIGTV